MSLFVANYEEHLIKGDAATETINIEDDVTSGEVKKNNTKPKQYWHEKKMYGYFIREKPKKLDKDRT